MLTESPVCINCNVINIGQYVIDSGYIVEMLFYYFV